MGFGKNVGKYQLHKTIGEGTFAKVKLAINTVNGEKVAIKIIDKHMVIKNNLINQVEREIRTMKLLHHPNIVRIHEVIGTKTKIYIVMEYVPGGQLSDKMSYIGRLSESEARKSFQQLIDAVDYCHCRGVYHRDLKPQNLLLDSKGNLKVSDFGLSTLRKPGTLLSTACGSPSYVAPELLTSRAYDGAPADVWSCGVILYELLSGDLPFDDHNLINLYTKISRADYTIPLWFMEGEKSLIRRIFDTNPRTRITVPEIIEDQWFQINYEPAVGIKSDYVITLDDVHAAFGSIKESEIDTNMPRSPSFINAFQLIAMSQDLDLSSLFEEQDNEKKRIKIGSMHSIDETIGKIEAAAKDMSLLVERRNNSKMKMHPKQKMSRCCRSCFDLSAEVIEVAPTHCVVELSTSTGELALYKEFCRSLSSMLTEESRLLTEIQEHGDVGIYSKTIKESKSKSCEKKDTDNKDLLGLDILPLDA